MSELQRIWAEHPDLNDFGFGLYAGHKHKPEEERRRIFRRNRAALLTSVERFETAVAWIQHNLQPAKHINKRRTSYGMKDIAEREIGYITNGVFIAAMIHCGYRHEVIGPNAQFNVLERSVKRVEKRTDGKVWEEWPLNPPRRYPA